MMMEMSYINSTFADPSLPLLTVLNKQPRVAFDPMSRSFTCIHVIQLTVADTSGNGEHLGLPSAPQYDSESGKIFIEYTNGTSKCGAHDIWTTRIEFICEQDAYDVS